MRNYKITWEDQTGALRESKLPYRNKTSAAKFKMHPDCAGIIAIEEI